MLVNVKWRGGLGMLSIGDWIGFLVTRALLRHLSYRETSITWSVSESYMYTESPMRSLSTLSL